MPLLATRAASAPAAQAAAWFLGPPLSSWIKGTNPSACLHNHFQCLTITTVLLVTIGIVCCQPDDVVNLLQLPLYGGITWLQG